MNGGRSLQRICLIVALLVMVLSLNATCKVYLVTMPYVSLREVLAESSFKGFLSGSALGLLNVQTGSYGNLSAGYATAGAGARAMGRADPVAVYKPQDYYNESQETAEAIYLQRSRGSLPAGALIFPDFTAIVNLNNELYYRVSPGLLASVLNLRGLGTAYIGNCGTLEEPFNPGALMAVNMQGVILEGENRETLRENPLKPYGVEADIEIIVELLQQTAAHLVVVELGDFERIESVASFLSPEAYAAHRKDALAKTALFLHNLMRLAGEEDTIVLFSPLQSAFQRKHGYGLGFIAVFREGLRETLLYSGTTKRPGLVTLTDLAPTLEAWAGISPAPFHPGSGVLKFRATDREEVVEYLLELDENSAILKTLRTRFYQVYISLLILTIIGAFVCIILFPIAKLGALLRVLLFSEAAVPFFLLFAGLVPGRFYLLVFFLLLALAFASGFFSLKAKRLGFLWPLLLGLGLFSLALDVVFDARLISRSVFGYDFQSGARFYGIGNEYMGYYAGLLLVSGYFLGFLLGKKHAQTVLLLVSVVLIAFPIFGANVGGGITMIAAAFAWIKVVLKKKLAPYLWALPVFLGIWVLADYFRGQSHLIGTILAISGGGVQVIWDTICRKLATNLRLWQYSLWTKGLIVFVVGLVLVFHRPVEETRKPPQEGEALQKLLLLTVITASFAVAFNDSGVVAGALVFLVPGCFILSSLLAAIPD